MEKLKIGFPITFEIISFYKFMKIKTFDKEHCFPSRCTSVHPGITDGKSVWYQKTFNRVYAELKPNLTIKKTLMFFHFFVNSFVQEIYIDSKNQEMHAIGLFMILIELEKFFESVIKIILPCDDNSFTAKRYYLDIKRRIFNIYYYYLISPKKLSFHINSLALFIMQNHKFKFKITQLELDDFIVEFKKRRKQLFYEFNQQFHYMYNKKSKVFFKYDFNSITIRDLNTEYLQNLRKKNKYKIKMDCRFTLSGASKKAKVNLTAELKRILAGKRVKKTENFFDNFTTWL